MASGEIPVTCPNCQHTTSLPIAAIKRDNYYCGRCFQKIPMSGIRPSYSETDSRPQPARPRKSSRHPRR